MLITLTILMNKSYSLDKEMMIPFFSLHQDYSPRAPSLPLALIPHTLMGKPLLTF